MRPGIRFLNRVEWVLWGPRNPNLPSEPKGQAKNWTFPCYHTCGTRRNAQQKTPERHWPHIALDAFSRYFFTPLSILIFSPLPLCIHSTRSLYLELGNFNVWGEEIWRFEEQGLSKIEKKVKNVKKRGIQDHGCTRIRCCTFQLVVH